MDDLSPSRNRSDDHETSREGADSVSYRAGTQKARLLNEYISAYPDGLTSEEAAERVGLIRPSSCYWKRVSELAQDGLIWETSETRKGLAGVNRMVYVLNPGVLAAQSS